MNHGVDMVHVKKEKMDHTPDVQGELVVFDQLVKKVDGFDEKSVTVYGNVGSPGDEARMNKRLLSQLCLVPEGIKYDVKGKTYIFDTVQHIACFLSHGVADNVDVWTRGGVMSDFVSMFGEDTGKPMKEKHGDMIGHIPLLIIKPCRAHLRAAHKVVMRDIPDQLCNHFDFWRPILHAKFACPSAQAALLETGVTYLIDKDFCEDWTGKITYPRDEERVKEYNQQKRAGQRVNGTLVGKNRMGKYLMAVRSEVRLISTQKSDCTARKQKKIKVQ